MTIDEIYAAINPLPDKLSQKGKVRPSVDFRIEANAGFSITMKWAKPHVRNDWEHEYQCFLGDDFVTLVGQAEAFINDLPSAEQARLHHFMDKLGKLIDAGKDDGIEISYLNPLVESMKRLSKNIITHKKRGRSALSKDNEHG